MARAVPATLPLSRPNRPRSKNASRRCTVDRTFRPRLLENESHRERIHDFNLSDTLIQFLRASAFVPLKAELHVLRRDGVAVVKLEPTAQLELVGDAIRALRPRLRQTVAHLLSRQRAHERIVERI